VKIKKNIPEGEKKKSSGGANIGTTLKKMNTFPKWKARGEILNSLHNKKESSDAL
jgi:hypothetical protein